MQPISFLLLNNFVIIKKFNFKDIKFINKLRSLGFYEEQIIYLKSIGNYKNMIGLEVNDITFSLRLEDAKHILVQKVNDVDKKTN